MNGYDLTIGALCGIGVLWLFWLWSVVGAADAKSDIVHDCNTFGRFEVHGKIYTCSEQKTP